MDGESPDNIVPFPAREQRQIGAGVGASAYADAIATVRNVLHEAGGTPPSLSPSGAAPESDPDWAAIDDEHVFAKRFGFDACRRRREQLLTLKHEADLTDREIRLLRRSSSLVFRDDKAAISSWWFLPVCGYLLVGIALVLMTLALLAALQAGQPSLWQMVKITIVEAMLLAMAWWAGEMLIRPHQIHRRVLRTMGTQND